MSATLTQLLTQAAARAHATRPGRAHAEQAIAALGHLARATEQLSTDGIDNRLSTARELHLATTQARACRDAADAWEPRAGAVPTLAGTAADLAARWSPQLSATQRWAIVVAVAETAADLCAAAQQHRPYAGLLALATVRDAALALEQHAALNPPGPIAATILDRAIPAPPTITAGPAHVALEHAAVEAATDLVAAVRSALANRTLTVADTMTAVAAARYATHHGALLVASVSATSPEAADTPDASALTWRAAASAWLSVQIAFAPFDDGTKLARRAPTNPVRALALQMYEAVRQVAIASGPPTASPDSAATGTRHVMLREVTTQLPALAEHLRAAADRWGQTGALLAPERCLARFELTTDPTAPADRVVVATPGDLSGVRTALTDAGLLSVGLAAQLDRLGPAFNERHAPSLATAYRQAAGEFKPDAADRRARTAQRRLHADPPPQWGYRPAPRHTPASRSR